MNWPTWRRWSRLGRAIRWVIGRDVSAAIASGLKWEPRQPDEAYTCGAMPGEPCVAAPEGEEGTPPAKERCPCGKDHLHHRMESPEEET